MSVISAKNIVKSFGKLEVLKDVSLEINEEVCFCPSLRGR